MAAKKRKKTMKKPVKIILYILLACFLFLIGYAGADAYSTAQDLKDDASALKNSFKSAVDSLEAEDTGSARTALSSVSASTEDIKTLLDRPIIRAASIIPGVGQQVSSVHTLVDIVEEAESGVITPAIDTIEQNPISQLKVGEDGFNVNIINSYLSQVENIMPTVGDLSEKLNTVNISFEKDKIDEYKEKLNNITDEYNELSDFLPVLHAILGDGSDRYYLFPVQNTAEIRACGGFPGSIGSITISNGVLTIGDFDTPYNVFPESEGEGWSATSDEATYFSENVLKVRDAGFIPDFSRVAYIWANGKEAQSGQHVDGVISMTPVMVQKMLAATGQSITLSDGTVLDGTNATEYLQYTIYDTYFQYYTGETANDITDALFAETAEKSMSAFVSAFSYKNIISYMPLFTEGIDERTLMFWFANADEEQTAINADCAGVLNKGVDNAETGVFFSISGTKAGWLFDINNQILDQTKNDDGTTTYHVQTAITNNFTQDILDRGNPYILNYDGTGTFHSFVQISAPYGALLSDVVCGDTQFNMGTYDNAALAYNLDVVIGPQETAVVTYTITTAADVTDELTFKTTPTLTAYRNAG